MRISYALIILLLLCAAGATTLNIVSDPLTYVTHADESGSTGSPAPWGAWNLAVVTVCDVAGGQGISDGIATDPAKNSWNWFDRNFRVPGCINTATLTIAGEDAVRSWINGLLVETRGTVLGIVPPPLVCDACTTTNYNVMPYLHFGQNEFSAFVRHYKRAAPTCLYYKLTIDYSDSNPPAITVTAPTQGVTYFIGTTPALSYTVADNCDPNPTVTVTGYDVTIGSHTINITAVDLNGNKNTVLITYTVAYPAASSPPDTSMCYISNLSADNGSIIGDTDDKVRRAEELGTTNTPDPASWDAWRNTAVIVDDTNPARPHPDGNPSIHWISSEPDNSINAPPFLPDIKRDTWREFTKCFDVCAVNSARLQITGDDALQITLNGQLVDTIDEITGPADWGPGDQPWRNMYTYDVTNKVHDGVNLLDILVRNYDLGDPTVTSNPTGTTYKLAVTSNDTTAPTITVNAPQDGATYTFGFVPLPSYSAVDTCDSAPVTSDIGYSGAMGTHTMVVRAVDKYGNIATTSVTYTVAAPPTYAGTNVICPAAPPYPPCCVSREFWEGGWIYLAFLAMSSIILLFAIVYMILKLTGKNDLVISGTMVEVWIKDEAYQILISLIIIILLIMVLSMICNVFITLAGSDPFLIAHSYLNSLIWDKTLNLATNAFQYSVVCQLLAAFRLQIGPGSLGVGYNPNAGARALSMCFDFIYAFFAGISASLMIQDMALSVIQAFAFRIMLPIGIIFRIFPFLRKAGGFLIALALGLYIVFPLCFVMNKMIVDSVLSTITLPVLETLVEPFVTTIISPFMPFALIGLYDLMRQAAELIPQALFLPTLNLVITFTFIKNAARILSQNFAEG